jgi:hypothetical protein
MGKSTSRRSMSVQTTCNRKESTQVFRHSSARESRELRLTDKVRLEVLPPKEPIRPRSHRRTRREEAKLQGWFLDTLEDALLRIQTLFKSRKIPTTTTRLQRLPSPSRNLRACSPLRAPTVWTGGDSHSLKPPVSRKMCFLLSSRVRKLWRTGEIRLGSESTLWVGIARTQRKPSRHCQSALWSPKWSLKIIKMLSWPRTACTLISTTTHQLQASKAKFKISNPIKIWTLLLLWT